MAPIDDLPEKERSGFSRRDFLKSAGVTGFATAVASAGVAEAQTGPAVVGPGEVPVSLMVNGRRIDLRIEPRVTLLDALRMRADLTGTRADAHPRRFTGIQLHYSVTGAVADDVVQRGIDLSREKYCSVWHSMRQDLDFTVTFKVSPGV